jgi:glycine/D-amino acid oxidase-like deaminating enzyme
VPGSLEPRPPLPGSTAVDVAIIGAGYTGLWTAYYLLDADPSLRVAVIEKDIAGFGASGRNGGWCSALYPVSARALAREHGYEGAVAQYAAMRDSLAEGVRIAGEEGIDADIARGGTVVVARSEPQLRRARDDAEEAGEFCVDLELLDADAARRRLAATHLVGGTYTPHCAALHPAKLARGLADAVARRGAAIHERTVALAIEPGAVRTERGTVQADVVVRATEGYTPGLRGQRRVIAPVYSLIVATEPLTQAVWDEIGLAGRETFADYRHLIIYGQRTADGRMVFGGAARRTTSARGSPRPTTGCRGCSPHSSARCASCSRCCAMPGSRIAGAARSASRATGRHRSASTARPASPGPAATSATGSRRRTSPGAHSPT